MSTTRFINLSIHPSIFLSRYVPFRVTGSAELVLATIWWKRGSPWIGRDQHTIIPTHTLETLRLTCVFGLEWLDKTHTCTGKAPSWDLNGAFSLWGESAHHCPAIQANDQVKVKKVTKKMLRQECNFCKNVVTNLYVYICGGISISSFWGGWYHKTTWHLPDIPHSAAEDLRWGKYKIMEVGHIKINFSLFL